MHEKNENIFYYITTMNENYSHPEMPKDKNCEEGILKGMYKIKEYSKYKKTKIQLLGSGAILREMMVAAEVLQNEYQIDSEIWSVTSFNELRRDALAVCRDNMLHPDKKAKLPFVTEQLSKQKGPVIATTDYMKAYSDQITVFVPDSYRVLVTDGFVRSDSRVQLRHFFEVDSKFVVLAGLTELKELGLVNAKEILAHMKATGINLDKVNPLNQ